MTREATIIEGLPEPAEDMLSCGETQPTDDERARDVMVCCWLNRGHWGPHWDADDRLWWMA